MDKMDLPLENLTLPVLPCMTIMSLQLACTCCTYKLLISTGRGVGTGGARGKARARPQKN